MQDKEIEEIRLKANIVDVISSYLPLTQKGKNYFGVCPFHEDHSPSMSVSEEKQIYKCFSCGAAGNVFTFVKEKENVSFLEAVKIVAEKCGLNFKGNISITNKKKTNSEEYEIMNLALKYYQNNLNTLEGNKAKEYLKARKLKEDVIKDFSLGLALNADYSLNKLLIEKNYKVDTLVNLGLVNRNGPYLNDVFNKRIIFPIHDLEGNPVGFTGRIYEDSDQAKYINSKESTIFKKGQILFNYHRALSEIKKQKEIVIVEGNMDAIRLYSEGVKNVVALMGTSMTKEQINVIKNLKAKVILMLDNDNAGEIATFKNGNSLEKAGITPFIVRLSGEKDPDEYIIKNGIEAIINNIKKPISFLDFKFKYFKNNKDLSKTEDLVSYIKEMVGSLRDVNDELTRSLTIKKISEEYNVPIDLINNELDKITIKKDVNIKREEKKEKKNISKYEVACQNILYFMMNDKVYIDRFKKDLGYLSIKKYRSIANEIIYYLESNGNINLADFISFSETKDYIYDDVMDIIKSVREEELDMNAFLEYIKAAESERVKEEIKEIKLQIATMMDESKKMELGKKLIELKKGCVGNE